MPVDAPLGTADLKRAPSPVTRSTSTVGLPLLSTIWRALTDWTADFWTAAEVVEVGAATAEARISRLRRVRCQEEGKERSEDWDREEERAAAKEVGVRRRLDWTIAIF